MGKIKNYFLYDTFCDLLEVVSENKKHNINTTKNEVNWKKKGFYRKTFAPYICCVNFDNTRCRASEMFPYLSKRALCFTLQRFSLIIVSTVEVASSRKFRADTESSAA